MPHLSCHTPFRLREIRDGREGRGTPCGGRSGCGWYGARPRGPRNARRLMLLQFLPHLMNIHTGEPVTAITSQEHSLSILHFFVTPSPGTPPSPHPHSSHAPPSLLPSSTHHLLVMIAAVAAVDDVPGVPCVLLLTQEPLSLGTGHGRKVRVEEKNIYQEGEGSESTRY